MPPSIGRGADPVRDFLAKGIAEGLFRYGQKLPTERELAARFSRSRGAVRKALTYLEAEAKIVRKVGSGTYVAVGDLPDGLPEENWSDISPNQLIEARLALEPQLVAIAVGNAVAADLSAIEDCLRQARGAADLRAFERADNALHLAIARATHNRLLVRASELINGARQNEEWGRLKIKRHMAAPNRRAEACAEHEAIVEALKERDQDLARKRMVDHLIRVQRNLFSF